MRSDPSSAAVRLVVPEARDRAEVPRFDAPAWKTRAVSPEPQSPAKDERDLRLEELGHDLRVPLSALSLTSGDNAIVFRVRLPKRYENSLRRDHSMEARP